MTDDKWWHDLPVKSEAELDAEWEAEKEAELDAELGAVPEIGCDWPGCPTRGNPALESGWLIANSSQHPDWPNHEGWYCPAHGAYITRWYEQGRYRRRRF
jgi:hypothetical protein